MKAEDFAKTLKIANRLGFILESEPAIRRSQTALLVKKMSSESVFNPPAGVGSPAGARHPHERGGSSR